MGAVLWALSVTPADAGGIFVTGQDPDYHAFIGPNAVGARRILQRSIGYLTNEMPNPRILLVTDLRNPGGDDSDPRLGLTAAGYTYDVADYGSGTPGVLDLHTVDFGNYDAVVVASDYGGWLRQDELDILNARRADIARYLSCTSNGAFIVLNESGNREGGGYPGTSHDRYGFLPVTLTALSVHSSSGGVTPAGTAMGLTSADTTGNPTHSVFTGTGGLDVVSVDIHGRPLSLVGRGDVSAPVITCRLDETLLWPPNHKLVDVGLSISVTDDCDTNVAFGVRVFSDEDDEEATGDGHHSPDAKRSAGGALRLRAERNGGRDGRVYLIIITATDAAGRVGTGCCTVVVPHSRSRQAIASVRAQAAAAERHCRTFGTPPPGYFVSGDGPVIGPKQ